MASLYQLLATLRDWPIQIRHRTVSSILIYLLIHRLKRVPLSKIIAKTAIEIDKFVVANCEGRRVNFLNVVVADKILVGRAAGGFG